MTASIKSKKIFLLAIIIIVVERVSGILGQAGHWHKNTNIIILTLMGQLFYNECCKKCFLFGGEVKVKIRHSIIY